MSTTLALIKRQPSLKDKQRQTQPYRFSRNPEKVDQIGASVVGTHNACSLALDFPETQVDVHEKDDLSTPKGKKNFRKKIRDGQIKIDKKLLEARDSRLPFFPEKIHDDNITDDNTHKFFGIGAIEAHDRKLVAQAKKQGETPNLTFHYGQTVSQILDQQGQLFTGKQGQLASLDGKTTPDAVVVSSGARSFLQENPQFRVGELVEGRRHFTQRLITLPQVHDNHRMIIVADARGKPTDLFAIQAPREGQDMPETVLTGWLGKGEDEKTVQQTIGTVLTQMARDKTGKQYPPITFDMGTGSVRGAKPEAREEVSSIRQWACRGNVIFEGDALGHNHLSEANNSTQGWKDGVHKKKAFTKQQTSEELNEAMMPPKRKAFAGSIAKNARERPDFAPINHWALMEVIENLVKDWQKGKVPQEEKSTHRVLQYLSEFKNVLQKMGRSNGHVSDSVIEVFTRRMAELNGLNPEITNPSVGYTRKTVEQMAAVQHFENQEPILRSQGKET